MTVIEQTFEAEVASLSKKCGSTDGWATAILIFKASGVITCISLPVSNEQARDLAPGDAFLVTVEQVPRE